MTDEVNIFLDTTLTYKDPFFKNNFNRNLLKLAEIHEFPLYMSKVVFDETRNKFEENVKQRILGLESALEELNNYYPTELNTATIESTIDDFVLKFDEFYTNLIEQGILEIIEINNDLLPILVERSIKRIKPFGTKKQEFRDAITWLSYATFAESKELDNCFFITENVNDFCQGKGNIHPDLLNDSERFKHYVSIKELFEKESVLEPLIRTVELVEWVNSENIDEDYVLSTLEKPDAFKRLFLIMQHYTFNSNIDYFVEDAYEEGYAELWTMDIIGVDDVETDVIGDEILISGIAQINAHLEIYLYNAYRASRQDDDYNHVGSGESELEIAFTFSYDQNREVNHIEVGDINLNTKINLGFYEDN
ncbi:PIN domain-containing protein [Lysinibacillus fusiformis]|uniref:PIN domain-containing protein n=1 Tax=Lysinibacillus fusiformis TaxID=28031 RepID=UPI00148DDF6D|nr:PIN domain-containing protein [Lysinibacillus fusiformis]NOG26573.1 DUF4935 domain-containing protein [Lysinibacillus fusiformis]